MTASVRNTDQFTSRTFAAFITIAFGLSWGIAGLLILFTAPLEAMFGKVSDTNPLFILAVYSPGIAGVFLVWRTHGVAGLRAFLGRLTLWRMSTGWWAVLLLGIPICFYAGAALKGNLGDPFPFSPWYAILPALLKALLLGPLEELGWRGIALPMLQRRMAPIWAGLTLGAIWGLWHIPAFMLSGTPQESWSFPAFFVSIVAVSVIMTAMFNASRGSLLVAALFHAQTNGPAWPDAQPWDTLAFVALAIAVVWVDRAGMFARGNGVLSVLGPYHSAKWGTRSSYQATSIHRDAVLSPPYDVQKRPRMPSPSSAISADLAEVLLQAAILAPSSHNTQPWRFRVSDDRIELRADRTRSLPVNDPHDRELAISCGCALFNIRVAAAAEGWLAHVSAPPAGADPDLLASLTVSRGAASEALGALAPLIAERRTYRKRFVDRPIGEPTIAALRAAVAAEGATLCVLHAEAKRHEAAGLVAEGDAIQWDDAEWRRELADWMHPRRRGDGLTMPALAIPAAQMVVRTFDMGGGVGAKDRELAEESPVLAVIGTGGDTVADWLAAGQALQNALLVGLTHGLQASYLNQPMQRSELRPRMQALCAGVGTPQLLVRWGVPDVALPAAPRRPLSDVMMSE